MISERTGPRPCRCSPPRRRDGSTPPHGLLTAAAARQEPTRALLELLAIKLVCRLFPMSLPNATDAARAAAGEYDTISPRRLGHYLRRDRWIQPAGLRTLATAINGGVIGGRGHATQRDAREAIAASPAEVIYLDPPYPGTTGYGAYGLLDTLLGDDLPAAPAPRLADLLVVRPNVTRRDARTRDAARPGSADPRLGPRSGAVTVATGRPEPTVRAPGAVARGCSARRTPRPEETVGWLRSSASALTGQHGELLPKGQVLEHQVVL